MYYVYVLEDADGKKYTGYSSDLKRRIQEHARGESFSTRHRRPLSLIYYEACVCESDARRREKYLKTTGGRRFLAKRIKDYLFG